MNANARKEYMIFKNRHQELLKRAEARQLAQDVVSKRPSRWYAVFTSINHAILRLITHLHQHIEQNLLSDDETRSAELPAQRQPIG